MLGKEFTIMNNIIIGIMCFIFGCFCIFKTEYALKKIIRLKQVGKILNLFVKCLGIVIIISGIVYITKM